MEKTPGIRPCRSLGQRLDRTARRGFPGAITIFAMIVAGAPFGLPGQAQLLPAITLASVFFWSLFRPVAFPPPFVFVLGLLADLMEEMPPGVSVLTLLLTQMLVRRIRRPLGKQSFLSVWLIFTTVAAVATALQWALCSLLDWTFFPPAAGLFVFLLATGLYPLIAIAFIQAHRSLAAPEQT
jgi:rod shape-determining protein MreD